jgi:uncharacterized membrane protein YfcA
MIDLFPLDASVGQLIFLGAFTFGLSIFAGMVGVALGAVRLPIMLVLGFNPVVAAGTNLGVTILGGTAAAWPHWRDGRVVGRVVLVLGVPAVVGSLLGGYFADDVRAWLLLALIAALSGISSTLSFIQWWSARRKAQNPDEVSQNVDRSVSRDGIRLNSRNQTKYGLIGLGIGIVGGASGMVLAVLRFPILINVLRMDPRHAAGTNNTLGVLAGIFGFVGHAFNMNFDIGVLAVMGVTGMVGSFIGAKQTGRISAVTMRLIIAVLLAGTTPLIVIRMFSEYPN